MALRIQYMSDLHLEFKDNVELLRRLPKKVTGDVLVVAGDAFYLGSDMLRSPFWQWASGHYRQVLMVPGNHEYYGGYDMMKRGGAWQWMVTPNAGYYHNRVVTVGDTDFILSTMWSYLPPEKQQSISYFLSDFHRIRYCGRMLTPDDYNAEHARSLAFIKRAVAASRARHRVVVTHHVPSCLCTPEKLKVIRGGSLADAFTADLTGYIRKAPVDCWIYGHSHVNFGTDLGGTLVTCNQLGYVFRKENEWNGFDFSKHIILR